MRKFLFAGLLSLMPTLGQAITPTIPAGPMIDFLEGHSGRPVFLHDRIFLHQSLDCLRPGSNSCPNPDAVRPSSDVEGRYCITRCTGTGSDRVCWEVCYED